ncbi:hypothetical protein CEXT_187671 [Caerostris extrusa]|uniref:Uncharacterized protein n=1 Tax=Caerostris extrusa TaxID=172846 RepID=A0AAV4WWB1_CAEEX|nr:hypothetical protein CEXT_187671 [Caerostris extrusa]
MRPSGAPFKASRRPRCSEVTRKISEKNYPSQTLDELEQEYWNASSYRMNRTLWSLLDRGGGLKDRNTNNNYSTNEFKKKFGFPFFEIPKQPNFSLVMSFQEASKFEATPELIFLLLRGTRVVSRRGQACLSRVTQSQSDILFARSGIRVPLKALVS